MYNDIFVCKVHIFVNELGQRFQLVNFYQKTRFLAKN